MVLLSKQLAYAIDSIDVLPKSIISPSFKQGHISSLDQKFTNSGSLVSLSDINAVELDLGALKQIDPRVSQLESALNQFGSNNLGTDLHLGVLRVQTHPTVSYSAPVLGYGVNSSWTLGFGVPIINYKNELSFSHGGSNVQSMREELYGLDPELDNAFNLLSSDISQSAQNTLIEKGYKPIKSRDETHIGDIQLASLWQIAKNAKWGVLLKSTLTLPTGPKDDADDLTDLPGFGQTALENGVTSNFFLAKWLTLSSRAGYKWAIADRVEKRVPKDSSDSLPDASQKAIIQRDIGDSFYFGAGATLNLTQAISIGGAIESGAKFQDSYSGNKPGYYENLEAETSSEWKKSIYEVSYSTVSSYFKGESLAPAVFTLNFSDVVAGRSIERQSTTEFSATMFF